MSTLLDSLTSLAAPATSQIAGRLGETDAAVSHAIPISLASVLAGLLIKTNDSRPFEQVFQLVRRRPVSADVMGDLQDSVSGLAIGVPSFGVETFLTTLFDGRTTAVGDLITHTVGFENEESGPSLLTFAAPLVLAILGKKVREGLDAGGLSNLLAAERDSIVESSPPGLMNLVDAGGTVPSIDPFDVLRAKIAARTPTYKPAPRRRTNRWMWPVAGIAAVALTWFFVTRRRPAESPAIVTDATPFDSATRPAGAPLRASAGEVGGAIGLGPLVKRLLPSGVELEVPERGMESKLIAFIDDGSRPVDDTTWFNFDRVNFASDSLTLLPESQDQLANIAAVLRAYPDVNVQIGGYAEGAGGPGPNMRLSQQRAEAVRQALLLKKLAASRVRAESYVEKGLAANNAAATTRTLPRHIGLRVTQK